MEFINTIQRLIESGTIETALRRGSSDVKAVKVLQEGLHNLGFSKALKWSKTGADGDYGPATAEAVKQFARRNGSTSNGNKVTAALGKKMAQRYNFLDELRHLHDAAQDPTLLQAIYRGSSQKIPIIVLQTILHELGYDAALNWAKYGADGDYGRGTTNAVKAFAHDNGLTTDGESVTQEMVKKALARFVGFFGPTWYEDSVMVEKESLSISETNKTVRVSDGTLTKDFRKFRLGVYTYGTQKPLDFITANRAMLKNLGMTNSAMNVMVAVAENEGSLDAINTWDNSFMTFGMFQWTIGQGEAQGELPALVKKIKQTAPDTFAQYFGRHGLDVTPKTGATNGFFTLNGRTLKRTSSKEALRTPKWAFFFWKAGQDPVVQSIQVQHALSRLDTFYRSPRYQVAGHDIADIITSEYGVGLVLDNHVNRPGYIKPCLQRAVVVAGLAGSNPANWNTAQENGVIQAYLKIRETYGRSPMTDAAKRAQVTKRYLDKGIISNKRGSFKFGG